MTGKANSAPGYQDRITIVSGLPRSGTSLMMSMLAAGGIPLLRDGIRAADEDNPRGYFEFEPVKQIRQDASWLGDATGKAVKMVHLPLYDLPPEREYNVILVHRNLEEVLDSQRKMLDRSGKAGGRLPHDAMRLALEWQLARITGHLSAHPNFAVMHADYNRLIADPAAQARQLATWLAVPNPPEQMAAVIEPALYRNRARRRTLP